ncbi:hypothetical protein [Pengzhenrongella frigida]|uniref:Uncharacterized protein n=1 Tax=Pengzhenrongella frigida TaxID=1259133 RepID=A0A4Q5N7X1_9MICO|nr:hypothetical protein [Cellulomonas sp. HLT2-17]RYV52731.1 hypothetical protein EUA98_01995 [Cellulomonas sp. HLT2-17]
MPREHRRAALLLALALAVGAGCAGPDSESSSPTTSQAAGSTGGSSSQEESGSASGEETSGTEDPAEGGGGGVSVELAGLPVGGGSTVRVGEAWCQALFWGSELPAGVTLEIDAVQVGEPGGTVQAVGCEDKPPCVGATISEDQRGCALAVVPPSPEPESVRVRLDGTLRCPDQATCDQVVVVDGASTLILRPSTSGTEDETGTDDGADESPSPSDG